MALMNAARVVLFFAISAAACSRAQSGDTSKTLVPSLMSATPPAVDGETAYVVADVAGTHPPERALYEVPLRGGSARMRAKIGEVPPKLNEARAIAAHAGTVYAASAGNSLWVLAPGDKAARPFPIGHEPFRLAADASHVYFITLDGTVGRMPAAGGPAQVLASGLGQLNAITLSDTDVYVGADGSPTSGILKLPKAGGASTVLGSGQTVSGLAADARGVVWTDTAGGRVMRLAGAGAALEVIASGERFPRDIAVDAVRVYWITSVTSEGEIRSKPKAGGPVTTMAKFKGEPRGMALGPGVVVWSTWGVEKRPDLALVVPGALMAVAR